MNALLKGLIFVLMGFTAFSAKADRFYLSFEGIPPGTVLEGVYAEYAGFYWSNFGVVTYPNEMGGSQIGAASGQQALYNVYDGVASVQRADQDVFNFHSVYMSSIWKDDLQVNVEGWLDGVVIYAQTVTLSTENIQNLNFNFWGIDTISFTPYGGTLNPNWNNQSTQFAVDEMFITFPPAVPEPTSLALLGLGLGMTVVWASRRQKR